MFFELSSTTAGLPSGNSYGTHDKNAIRKPSSSFVPLTTLVISPFYISIIYL